MLRAEPKVGWIFRYSYLWHWQHQEGREEGDKDRPVLVLALVASLADGTPIVRVSLRRMTESHSARLGHLHGEP